MEAVVSRNLGGKIGHCVPLGTHETLILCKEDGDASIDFSDSQRDQHVRLRGRLIAVYCWLLHVCLSCCKQQALAAEIQ